MTREETGESHAGDRARRPDISGGEAGYDESSARTSSDVRVYP
ncbi:hypothetical protein [Streptomyces atratus]|nr:hypothetical protein [Streptomyces atratus]